MLFYQPKRHQTQLKNQNTMKKKLKLIIFFVAKITGLFYLSKILTFSQGRILCYHAGSLGDEWEFNKKLFITTETFTKRIEWLKKNKFEFSSLEDIKNNQKFKISPRAYLTFDDGWYSTYSKLIPILSQNKIPSTLYLCTGLFQNNFPVLPVIIRFILWKTNTKEAIITGLASNIDGVYDLTDSHTRDQFENAIVKWISANPTPEDVITGIICFAEKLGISANDLKIDSRRFSYMTLEELRSLPSEFCSIQLHGHNHAYPSGKPDEFRRDLLECKRVISEMGFPKPIHYCYPSGEFDDAASQVLNDLHVESATTCKPGLVSDNDIENMYYLPRFVDGEDVTMLEFEAEMVGLTSLMRKLLTNFGIKNFS